MKAIPMSHSYSADDIEVIDLSPLREGSPPTYSIYDLLDKLHPRTAMYVGSNGVKGLDTFLMAYELAMQHAGIRSVAEPEFYGFHEFVRLSYGFSNSTAGWANWILAAVVGCDRENTQWDDYDKSVTPQQYDQSIFEFNRLLGEYRGKES